MRNILVSPGMVTLVGANAAIVYAQLSFWLTKAAIRRRLSDDGWLAKTREELAEETGLSFDQVKRALSLLKQKGFIESKQMAFEGGAISHHRLGDIAPPGGADSHHPSLYREEKRDMRGIESDARPSSSLKSGKVKKALSVSEISDGRRASEKIDPVDATQAVKPMELVSVFRQAWADEYPDKFLPSFTAKQLGMFGHFSSRCPEGQAGVVLDYAVRNWGRFIGRAESDEGGFKLSGEPHVPTLLRFIKSAVNLYWDHLKDVAESQKGPKVGKTLKKVPVEPVAAPEPKPEPKPGDDDYVPKTIEEIAAIWYSDDDTAE